MGRLLPIFSPMKTILTLLSLCFCATMYAQGDSAELTQKEETPSYTPFAWYLEQEEQREEFLREKLESINSSAVFEVRIPERDNLSYFSKKDSLVALDIISNSVVFRKLNYEDLLSFYGDVSGLGNIEMKRTTDDLINNYEELIAFINSESLITFEGYVFEDSAGFMFKWKSPIYNVLKTLRSNFGNEDQSNTYRSLATKGLLDNRSEDREFYLTKGRLKVMIEDLNKSSEFPSNLSSLQQFMIQGSLKY